MALNTLTWQRCLANLAPSGTIEITENGEYDVMQYATADVNVSGGVDVGNLYDVYCINTEPTVGAFLIPIIDENSGIYGIDLNGSHIAIFWNGVGFSQFAANCTIITSNMNTPTQGYKAKIDEDLQITEVEEIPLTFAPYGEEYYSFTMPELSGYDTLLVLFTSEPSEPSV